MADGGIVSARRQVLSFVIKILTYGAKAAIFMCENTLPRAHEKTI